MSNDSAQSTISRRAVMGAVSAGIGTGLAGCLGNGSSGSNSKELLLWSAIFDDSQMKPWAKWYKKTFKKNHPDAQLKTAALQYANLRQKFLTGARQGSPDAIEGVPSHLSEYIAADLVSPITDRAKDLPFADGYTDGAWKAMTYKGDVYALPYTGNGRAFVYRKDIFEKHGLKPPNSAEAFLEAGRVIQENEDGVTAFHNCTKDGSVRGFQEWISHVYQHVDDLYKPNGDSWTLVPSADLLGKIFDAFYYRVWASDQPIANPEELGTGWQINDYGYVNGNYAMIECGPWLRSFTSGEEVKSNTAKTILSEKTAIAHLPRAKGGKRATYLEVKPVMVNSYSKQQKLAFDTVKHFASPESLKKMADVTFQATPVHKSVESSIDDPDWKPFVEVFETGKPLAKLTWGPVREAFYPLMQKVAYGKTDPYKAGKQFHKQLKQIESEI